MFDFYVFSIPEKNFKFSWQVYCEAQNDSINFTVEIQLNNLLSFLHLLITRQSNDQLRYAFCSKPIHFHKRKIRESIELSR